MYSALKSKLHAHLIVIDWRAWTSQKRRKRKGEKKRETEKRKIPRGMVFISSIHAVVHAIETLV